MQDELHLDWETKSVIDLKKEGLDRYSAHHSTRILMGSYAFNNGREELWEARDGPMPAELREALADPEVIKYAFNAQFERIIAKRVAGIDSPTKNWRCVMALANMQGFSGDLARIGANVGLPIDLQKHKDGTRLIKMFTGPQKVTKNQPHVWRDWTTDPEDWDLFGDYCIGDTGAERGIKTRLIRYPIQQSEWDLYELDQDINERGLPMDMQFVGNALEMANRRTAELVDEMKELTGLANPNSTAQLLRWLKPHDYPFDDMRADTVKKVITEHEESVKEYLGVEELDPEYPYYGQDDGGLITAEAHRALKLRQNAARTSFRKYTAMQNIVGEGDRIRFVFQFAGAARTSRWAGRRIQPHNFPRPPKSLEDIKGPDKTVEARPLEEVTELIRNGDYDGLGMCANEPFEALVGTVRSSIRAPEGYELRVADLAAIETRVTAWLARCERLLRVFREGGDPYIDFGTDLYHKPYAEITKRERQNSKPAVLGCTYRLGGGDLRDGKRTGLWGYAESMGVNLTQAESELAVKTFRSSYAEIPQCWYALENAVKEAIRTGRKVVPSFKWSGQRISIPVTVELRKPYLMIWLPTVDEYGERRALYYHLPRIQKKQFKGRNGEPYTKDVFSYMGKKQNSNIWTRVQSHGGKIFENLVQAIARDILKMGMLAAAREGFNLIGHVHDEIVTLQRKGDNYFTVQRLIECMIEAVVGCEGLPLDAAGYSKPFYRKD